MPSSYTSSFRLTLQAAGENNNTWGTILNNGVFQSLEDALAGAVALTVSGAVTLTSVNGAPDQARMSALICTGTGGTITAPSVKKSYLVDATSATGAITITTGGGSVAVVEAGNRAFVNCADGTNFNLVRDVAGLASTLAAAKTYTDNKVVGGAVLPGSSTPRSVVWTDPVSGAAQWHSLTTADISDAASRKFAIAMACAL